MVHVSGNHAAADQGAVGKGRVDGPSDRAIRIRNRASDQLGNASQRHHHRAAPRGLRLAAAAGTGDRPGDSARWRRQGAAETHSPGGRDRERSRLLGQSQVYASARSGGLALAGLFRRTRSLHVDRDAARRSECRFDGRRDQSQIRVEFHRCRPDRPGQRRLRHRTNRPAAHPFRRQPPSGRGSQRPPPGRRHDQARRRTRRIRKGPGRTLRADRWRGHSAVGLVRLLRAAVEHGAAAGLQLAVSDRLAAGPGSAPGRARRRADGPPHGRADSRTAGRRPADPGERIRPSPCRPDRRRDRGSSRPLQSNGRPERSPNEPAISRSPSAS